MWDGYKRRYILLKRGGLFIYNFNDIYVEEGLWKDLDYRRLKKYDK